MFRVRWKRVARDGLAQGWLQAADRNAVTAAAHRIEQLLRRDPEQQGESRDKGRRVLIVPPLAVLFKVNPQDRVVDVLRAWTI